ncbi:MAG TPA: CBS domain-containing protein [Gemmatimonadales bacterium]|nr:CBS domain-containing protein [Gemmatimonadales bacterium]
MKTELQIVAEFVHEHPEETAAVLERVSFNDAAALLAELDPSLAAEAIARLSASLAVDCLRSMHGEQVVRVLTELPVDLTARLLRLTTEETRERWLRFMPQEAADLLARKLRYPPATAGALADPLVLALPGDTLVAEAQKHMRRTPERAYYYIYVLDRDQRLVGVLDVRELMHASGRATLASVMHPHPVRVPAQLDLGAMVEHPAWRDFDALPVVDSTGVFFGIIRHRTIRQTVQSAGSSATQPVVRALIGLGELYWTGLALLLTKLGSRRRRPT